MRSVISARVLTLQGVVTEHCTSRKQVSAQTAISMPVYARCCDRRASVRRSLTHYT